jgi:molybdate transport system regulatory protein
MSQRRGRPVPRRGLAWPPPADTNIVANGGEAVKRVAQRTPPATPARRTKARVDPWDRRLPEGCYRTGMARLTIRVDLGKGGALGPGKIRLLEQIHAHGSISEAGRSMGMSYRRAWLLVDSLNRSFRQPVVSKQTGGRRGGGARLTPWGRRLVERYRAIETDAALAVAAHLRVLASARSGRRLAPPRRLVPSRRRPGPRRRTPG